MDEDDGGVSLIFCDRNDDRLFDLGEQQAGTVQLIQYDEHGERVPWTPKAHAGKGQV